MTYNVMDIKKTWFKREKNEPKVYKESTLYHKIRRILKDAGFDVVRQVPAKDGHLTGAPYYIRDRKHRFCLFDECYAIRLLTDVFNDFERVELIYHDLGI